MYCNRCTVVLEVGKRPVTGQRSFVVVEEVVVEVGIGENLLNLVVVEVVGIGEVVLVDVVVVAEGTETDWICNPSVCRLRLLLPQVQ